MCLYYEYDIFAEKPSRATQHHTSSCRHHQLMMKKTTPLKRRRTGRDNDISSDPFFHIPFVRNDPPSLEETPMEQQFIVKPKATPTPSLQANTNRTTSVSTPQRTRAHPPPELGHIVNHNTCLTCGAEIETPFEQLTGATSPFTRGHCRNCGAAFRVPEQSPLEATLNMSQLHDWETLDEMSARMSFESRHDDKSPNPRSPSYFDNDRDDPSQFVITPMKQHKNNNLIISLVDSNQLLFTGTVSEGSTVEKGWGVFSHFVKKTTKYEKRAAVYEGSYQDGKFQGKGLYRDVDGYMYEGEFNASQRHGQGKAEWSRTCRGFMRKKTYDGQWKDDEMDGRGRQVEEQRDGNDVYAGEFCGGLRNGFGTATYVNGDIYMGSWKQGKMHGIGELRNSRGKVLHNGTWIHGKFSG